MRTTLIVVQNPLAEYFAEVAFVERIHKIEAFSSHSPDQSLPECVRFGSPHKRLQHTESKGNLGRIQL